LNDIQLEKGALSDNEVNIFEEKFGEEHMCLIFTANVENPMNHYRFEMQRG